MDCVWFALIIPSDDFAMGGYLLILRCLFVFFQVYPNYINPNESCRLLLISAMVDDHTFEIDHAIERYGDTQDKSVYNGHFYTAKPIGYIRDQPRLIISQDHAANL
jgi:hypothetical protein